MASTLGDLRQLNAPPVCVCAVPRFDGPCRCDQKRHVDGECRTCHRPHKPEFPGFNECRQAWIEQLAGAMA